MRFPFLLLFLFVVALARAQDVREESPIGNGSSTFRHAAEDAGADWPYFSHGDRGTTVRITFDPKDADITVSTNKDFGEARLLETMKRLAAELRMPKGDFVVYPYPTSVSVDLEMNDYLRFPDKNRTEFETPVGKVARFLEASGLPKPIDIGVEGSDADQAMFAQPGIKARPITGIEFFASKQIADDATVRYSGSISPWGYLALIAMGSLVVGVLALPWRLLLKPKPAAVEPTPPKTPEEIQSEYDKKRPLWRALWPALVIPFVLLSDVPAFRKVLESAFMLLPHWVVEKFLPLLFGVSLLNFGGFALIRRFRQRNAPTEPGDTPNRVETKRFATSMLPLLLGFGWLMLCMAVMSSWPGFSRLGLAGAPLRAILLGPPFLALAVSIVLTARQSKKSTRRLAPGDLWFDRTQELSAKVGVKVRHVIVRESSTVNAFANLFHDVGLTSGLLEKMEPEEIDAVIAHELGHHRQNDVRKMFAFSLIFLLGIILFFNYPFEAIADHFQWSPSTRSLFSGPLVFFFAVPFLQSLVFGKARRRHEHNADAFAAWAVGDKELVIRALTKMTQINQSPARLKPVDEVLSSHPSLVNRIEALRSLDLSSFDPGAAKAR